jgi:tRNA U38,U39,U40 pseudouridine synthase TruA
MRLDSDRFLVALGCHGHAFHGSQVQPDVRTVEGSLLEREWLARLS